MLKKVLITGECCPFNVELEHALRLSGIKVVSVPTAEKALRLHRTGNFDIIVSDLDVPSMGGDGLCSRIRQENAGKRSYFMMACSGSRADDMRARHGGANEILIKPLDPDYLINRMVQILDYDGHKATRVLVKASLSDGFRGGSFYGYTDYIKDRGMDLETYKTLARGDRITCAFCLNDTRRLEASGTVERVRRGRGRRDYVCSVKFTGEVPLGNPQDLNAA